MALFESYDRREPQILAVLKNYGINSAREFVEQIDSHIDHQAAQEKNR